LKNPIVEVMKEKSRQAEMRKNKGPVIIVPLDEISGH
jgi:hypothetical protein